MPRISRSLLRQAHALDWRVARLLPTCRDLLSAQNELRWLREHSQKTATVHGDGDDERGLNDYVVRRSRGEPLQYILGSEYFGNLEIKCRPGVLIPRPETAASVSHLVRLITESHGRQYLPKQLHVLDLCTGSGCIPLLFHHAFYQISNNKDTTLHLTGVDLSRTAFRLAKENHAVRLEGQSITSSGNSPALTSLRSLRFVRGNVLSGGGTSQQNVVPYVRDALAPVQGTGEYGRCDILISNPPYISSKAFRTTTAKSVRHFEPKLALVPSRLSAEHNEHDGDIFYPRLLRLADELEAKVILFEVADFDQAKRVAALAVQAGLWNAVEIWRDEPAAREIECTVVAGKNVAVRGAGHGRSVFAYRGEGGRWLGK